MTIPRQSSYARSSSPTGPPRRHGAGAWVRPCHVDKPERSRSGSQHAPRTSPHQDLSAFTFLRNDQWQTGKRGCSLHSSFALTCKNPQRTTAGSTTGSLFSHAIHLRVKREASEHRDSGALTGSPALTPSLDPRHHDMSYQRRLSSLEGRGLRT